MNAQQLKKFNAWALAAFEQMADDKAAGMAQLEQHDAPPAAVQKERKAREPYPEPHAARRERQKRLFG